MATMEDVTPDLRKVNKAHMFGVCKARGVSVTSDVRGAVKALAATFLDLPANKLADCDHCGGQSDASLDACPWCGVGDDDGANGSNGVHAGDDEHASDDEHDVVADTPSTPSTVAMIAGARSEKDLDEAVARVNKLKAEGGRNLWLLGQEIGRIYEGQLWKQRTAEDKPRYKSFEEFAKTELGYGKTSAYWMMDVAKAFDERLALEYGVTKLGHILQAPKEDRNLLLERMKAGASVRELAKDAKKKRSAAAATGARVEGSRTRDSMGRSTAGRGRAAEPKKKSASAKKSDTITVGKLLGKQQVKLFCKPEKRDGELVDRARKITDRPVGRLEMENGVVETFALNVSSAGELFLVVERVRE